MQMTSFVSLPWWLHICVTRSLSKWHKLMQWPHSWNKHNDLIMHTELITMDTFVHCIQSQLYQEPVNWSFILVFWIKCPQGYIQTFPKGTIEQIYWPKPIKTLKQLCCFNTNQGFCKGSTKIKLHLVYF